VANIANRSPWVVQAPSQPEKKFRLKSQAVSYIDDNKLAKAKFFQLETAFEVQIKLKDTEGNIVTRSATLNTRKEAEDWAKGEENEILSFRKENGSFDISFETVTLAEALRKFVEEHYKGRPSYKENSYRTVHLIDWLDGERTLLRNISAKTMLNFRKKLQGMDYSPSSIRNYFTVLMGLFKHAKSEWLYPLVNPVSDIKLPKANNAVERYWEADEEERFFKSVDKHRPWIRPIVQLALEMGFRMGELVSSSKTKNTGEQTHGLLWEGVNFKDEEVRLFQEKNDWKKKNTETLGRTVPMTADMKKILSELYESHPTKKGPVFSATRNSLSHAFTEVCRLAEPPIVGLTFHSCRKIATYDLSKKVKNPMLLGKLTGHRDIVTLSERYYKAPINDLKLMLAEANTEDLVERGIIILEQHMTRIEVAQFLSKIRLMGETKEPQQINEEQPLQRPEEPTS
jgi:integrase